MADEKQWVGQRAVGQIHESGYGTISEEDKQDSISIQGDSPPSNNKKKEVGSAYNHYSDKELAIIMILPACMQLN